MDKELRSLIRSANHSGIFSNASYLCKTLREKLGYVSFERLADSFSEIPGSILSVAGALNNVADAIREHNPEREKSEPSHV